MNLEDLECADCGGALDCRGTSEMKLIQSGVALRLPPHSKMVIDK
jgi:hypothetical protein